MTDLVERVARAMKLLDARTEQDSSASWEDYAALAVRLALEEAARVSRPPSHMLGSADPYANGYRAACADIAAAIRAMIKD
jgi:uncharacterized protein involved in propanediol utilization